MADRNHNTVAFLIHPVDIISIRNNFSRVYKNFSFLAPLIKIISDKTLKRLYSSFSPHKFLEIDNIVSSNGSVLDLIVMMLPLFPSQIIMHDKKKVINQIVQACKVSANQGAKLLSLGGFTSVVGDQGREVREHLGNVEIALTTGNSLTAALSAVGILEAARLLNKNTLNMSILIVGATGDIGSAVAKVLSKKFKQITLMSRNINEASPAFQAVKNINANCSFTNRLTHEIISENDVVFLATSAIEVILEPKFLKKGAIVADVSVPGNVASLERGDVYIFEAGKAKVSFYDQLATKKTKFLFPKNSIYGCLAEALILGFENRIENYSLGRGQINEDKMNEIIALGKKHGIILSDFYFANKNHVTEMQGSF